MDTGGWVAVADRSDQYHSEAAAFYRNVFSRYHRLITTELVLAEGYALLRRGMGTGPAVRWMDSLLASSRVEIVFADVGLLRQGRSLLARYADQDFSLTDAVSFAVMRQRGVREAFSFDKHFITAGFRCVPQLTA